MNEYQAQSNGYHYCGPTISSYATLRELEHWEADKKFAQELKKNYSGADYVIASGTKNGWLSSGSKAIFGNEVFNRIYHLIRYNHYSESNLDEIIKQKTEKAEKDYQEALAQIQIYKDNYQIELDFLNQHKI